MFGNDRRWPAAALASGFLALVWVGCDREPSVASKSAAAFREAQKKGETFEDSGHSHGHGAMTSGGAAPEESAPGHDHGQGQAETAPAMGHGGEAHGASHTGPAGHSGRAGMDHGQSGQDRAGHAGHAMQPTQSGQTGHSGHEGHAEPADQNEHAGHDMSPQSPSAAAPLTVSPGQPAKTLVPDPLDAPVATSVVDSQRSAEMAEEMSGGHGAHGAGTYRQTDAGRGPERHEGSEPQTPGHEGRQRGDHSDHGAHDENENEAAAAYVCPMHPEVTSATPGKCPKCGMDLVKRRQG